MGRAAFLTPMLHFVQCQSCASCSKQTWTSSLATEMLQGLMQAPVLELRVPQVEGSRQCALVCQQQGHRNLS